MMTIQWWQCFHQCTQCIVYRCPDSCWLCHILSTSASPCWHYLRPTFVLKLCTPFSKMCWLCVPNIMNIGLCLTAPQFGTFFTETHCTAHWKAHDRLPIHGNETFLPSSYGWEVRSRNLSKLAFFQGGMSLWVEFISGRKWISLTSVGARKQGLLFHISTYWQ